MLDLSNELYLIIFASMLNCRIATKVAGISLIINFLLVVCSAFVHVLLFNMSLPFVMCLVLLAAATEWWEKRDAKDGQVKKEISLRQSRQWNEGQT